MQALRAHKRVLTINYGFRHFVQKCSDGGTGFEVRLTFNISRKVLWPQIKLIFLSLELLVQSKKDHREPMFSHISLQSAQFGNMWTKKSQWSWSTGTSWWFRLQSVIYNLDVIFAPFRGKTTQYWRQKYILQKLLNLLLYLLKRSNSIF